MAVESLRLQLRGPLGALHFSLLESLQVVLVLQRKKPHLFPLFVVQLVDVQVPETLDQTQIVELGEDVLALRKYRRLVLAKSLVAF